MSKLDSAMERFSAALDQLEAGINRRSIKSQNASSAEREIAALREDRSRLADELDQVKSQARQLDETAGDVSTRLEEAIAGIRAVLEP
ncbi:DUF4164 family protein [Pyruvatibacter mobilis]|jgi:predicted  nucleic acid-binding Zn-ribbon protein|uniref:DUF4164 family protein n=1 Tax=Pyruvatibacter mobilis TaxID=1712261 RepID=A0A845QER1_9HYPH|nr:DUF4164 family protein [Pyruvatibacter mobilis]NBG96726.1 DUF4164 family protein [Pyruvatibacter mobilis]QJD74279.1 DUF4164 family protein [Pyruvatibacter mobilis]GGD05540.1 hypothetical protein GCM10011587_06830 [Pyruvatibacter mobilis]